MRKFLLAGMIGGVIAYFLDPNKGSKRRSSVAGTLGGPARNFGRGGSSGGQNSAPQSGAGSSSSSQFAAAEQQSWAATQTGENVQPATGNQSTVSERVSAQRDNPNPDDLTLRDRVESQIFADTETSRENININVIDGIVEVRGELPQGEIDALLQHIKGIPDVKGVHSYLHTPGTPAPNKVSVLEVSS